MTKRQCATFGKRLAELRTNKELTQAQLADITDIQRVTIAKYEIGERAPSIDNLLTFVDFFGVSADYLLGLTNIKSNDPDIVSVCKYTGLSDTAIICLKQEQELYKKYFSSDEFFLTINEVLCDRPFYYAILHLIKLKESGIKWLKDIKENMNPRIYTDFDEMVKRKYEKEVNQYNTECDARRYKAIIRFEELIDKFDVRKYNTAELRILENTILKEAPDNGEHPSPKE